MARSVTADAPPERSEPRVLLLDVMDTLVRDPFRDVMPAFFGMSLGEMLAAKHPSAFVEFELAQRSEQSFLDDFFADRRAYDTQGFVAAIEAAYEFLPGIEPLLARLRDAGVELHTASNYPAWHERVERRTGLSRYVAWTGISCELGVRKPDPSFFERLLARVDRHPAECVFVDDQPRNCEAAAKFGIDAIRFVDAEQLERELASRMPSALARASGISGTR